MDENKNDDLLLAWNIKPPFQFLKIEDELGFNSQNMIVDTTSGVLLKSVSDKCRETFIESLEIQNFAAENGAPVPRVLSTVENSLVHEGSGNCYGLMEFCSSDNQVDAQERPIWVAHSLAQLHTVLRDCPIVPENKSGYDWLTNEEWNLIKNELENSSSEDPFGANVLEYFEICQSISKKMSDASPTQLVHLDCHPANVCFPAAGLPRIIDFGHIQQVPRMLALSFCCHRFAGFDNRMTSEFYEAYSATEPLENTEIKLHWKYLILESSRRINYLLRQHFFESETKWDFELNRKLEVIQQAVFKMMESRI